MRQTPAGGAQLIGYVVSNTDVDADELRRLVCRPSCPSTWCRPPSWCSTSSRSPRTARSTAARCPRRRSPAPVIAGAPTDPRAQAICEIFAELLGVRRRRRRRRLLRARRRQHRGDGADQPGPQARPAAAAPRHLRPAHPGRAGDRRRPTRRRAPRGRSPSTRSVTSRRRRSWRGSTRSATATGRLLPVRHAAHPGGTDDGVADGDGRRAARLPRRPARQRSAPSTRRADDSRRRLGDRGRRADPGAVDGDVDAVTAEQRALAVPRLDPRADG